MILTSEIQPSPTLSPFVNSYAYREFDTMGADMIKPWHASYEMPLVFFFKDKPVHLISPDTGTIVKRGTFYDIVGLGTQYNGEMILNGKYAFFEINFKLGGLCKIFDVLAVQFMNRIVSAEDLFGSGIKVLYEQLCTANGIEQMAESTNKFLINHLKRKSSNTYQNIINRISNLIIRNAGIIDIAQLAGQANMSIRTLERHFIKQTGITLKLLCSIARFNRAFSLKLNSPEENWTSVAQWCGYFDQMHLIREFKRFSGSTPSIFLKETPLTEVQYTNR